MRDLDMDNEGDHRVTEKAPELPDPETIPVRVAHYKKRVRRALGKAGVKVGGDHLIPALVEMLQEEGRATRDAVTSMVLQLEQRGCTLHDPMMPEGVSALGNLAVNLRQHFIQHDGTIGVLLPEEG